MQDSAENNGLLEKIRELEALNAELKTINAIASQEYKETIQRLYTNLEYIVSHNARSLNDASKANVRRAQATIQRMKLLSDDVGHFLQLHDFGIHKSMIDPNPVLERVIDSMKGKLEQANSHIDAATIPLLLADPLLLSILLVRLLENAIKFRRVMTSPLIRVYYSRADEIIDAAGTNKDNRYIAISVSDNGIGFPEEEAEKIFELFYHGHANEKHKGSGIGLAICKKIMTMHGGFITAEGIPATGATFHCYFPQQ